MSEARLPSGEAALARMRRYTTLSMAAVMVFYAALTAVGYRGTPWLLAAFLLASAVVVAHTLFWEHGAPIWLAVASVSISGIVWIADVVVRATPLAAFAIAVAIALQVSLVPRRRRAVAVAVGLLAMLAPVGVAALVWPEQIWWPWTVGGVCAYIAGVAIFALNSYGWGLYLEIDAARRTGAALAVAQERYRFAADLHDIQGHTLHVIKLKTQLARRLMDSDPGAAKAHLLEAEQLIAETLTNTRSLAFGERHVALASELANAGELLAAAGIGWTVTGEPTPSDHDELLGLVVRETTTNILRHAQATGVRVEFGAGLLRITNDGSAASTRPLSGLRVLGERLEAVGGSLRTAIDGDRFTTEVRLA